MYTYHPLLSNHWGFKINAIMKCGTYRTVVIMQAVYCLIGSVLEYKVQVVEMECSQVMCICV